MSRNQSRKHYESRDMARPRSWHGRLARVFLHVVEMLAGTHGETPRAAMICALLFGNS